MAWRPSLVYDENIDTMTAIVCDIQHHEKKEKKKWYSTF
jgi:hypothetical protein